MSKFESIIMSVEVNKYYLKSKCWKYFLQSKWLMHVKMSESNARHSFYQIIIKIDTRHFRNFKYEMYRFCVWKLTAFRQMKRPHLFVKMVPLNKIVYKHPGIHLAQNRWKLLGFMNFHCGFFFFFFTESCVTSWWIVIHFSIRVITSVQFSMSWLVAVAGFPESRKSCSSISPLPEALTLWAKRLTVLFLTELPFRTHKWLWICECSPKFPSPQT